MLPPVFPEELITNIYYSFVRLAREEVMKMPPKTDVGEVVNKFKVYRKFEMLVELLTAFIRQNIL